MSPNVVHIVLGNVLIVRATEAINAEMIPQILSLVSDTRRRVGRMLIYVAVIPPGAEVPSDATRAAMEKSTSKLYRDCESITLLLEGNGLKENLIRTLLRGMALLTGMRARLHIVRDLREALGPHADALGMSVAEAAHAADRAGVVVLARNTQPRP